MKRIYFIRHCQAKGQSIDAALTEIGRSQAIYLQDFFRTIDVDFLISSPYRRAIDSLKPLAEIKHLTIHLDHRLSERILCIDPIDNWLELLEYSFVDMNFSFPDGESSQKAMDRANELIDELISSQFNSIVVMSHGNLTALMLKIFKSDIGYEDWLSMSNPDVFEVVINEKGNSVKRIWDAS
ncbi:phosphoglycerate mutase family protein [Bacillus timonensis]|nr:phosphoglycerate mutase family protein [Bacillus timonensis]